MGTIWNKNPQDILIKKQYVVTLRRDDGKLLYVPQVESVVERVIVFLLSQVVERSSEEEPLFSLHPRTESCKLLWRDGQAVGFYTVKHKGRMEDWSER